MSAPRLSSLVVPASRPALLEELRARPALLLRELLWRWSCGGLLLLLAGYDGFRILHASMPALQATGIFSVTGDSLLQDPSELSTAFSASSGIVRPQLEQAALGIAPLAIFCWVLAFGFGRRAVLAAYDARLACGPWLLVTCELIRVGAMLAASAVWGWLVELASYVALRGEAPHILLYGLLVCGATAAVLMVWGRVARAVELCMALAMVRRLPFGDAFAAAWRFGSGAEAPRLQPIRKAASRLRLYLLLAAGAFTFLPAPFSTGWPLGAWWAALSLLLLAGADAVRLGVLFALVQVVREAGSGQVAGLRPADRQ